MTSRSLPIGAVRTDDGDVVIPESRRADGSIRKQVRIRPGYVPQDQVPKYKTIAQRRREQEQHDGQATAVVEGLQTLSINESSDTEQRSNGQEDSKTHASENVSSRRPDKANDVIERTNELTSSISQETSQKYRRTRRKDKDKSSGNSTKTLRVVEL